MLYLMFIISLAVSLLQISELSWKPFKFRPWAILLCSVTLCILSIIDAIDNSREVKYNKNYGRLDGSISQKEITVPKICVGGACFTTSDPTHGLFADILWIWLENDELFLSTILRDHDGKLIAKMVANEWQINPNQSFDRNFDRRSVEIKNNNDEIVLQVYYDGEKANFAGIFYNQEGFGYCIIPNPHKPGCLLLPIREGEKPQYLINPMFKFPSAEYPGEKVNH